MISWIPVVVSALLVVQFTNVRTASNGDPDGYSPSIVPHEKAYSVDTVAFADIDGDGAEDFVFLASTDSGDTTSVKLGELFENQVRVKWSSNEDDAMPIANTLAVGNVDLDSHSELILICTNKNLCGNRNGIYLLDWDSDSFSERRIGNFPINTASLVDVDGDGVQEIAYVVNQGISGNVDRENHVLLSIARIGTDGLEELHSVEHPRVIRSIIADDLDGDGIDEIITEEEASNGSINGQLTIYRITADNGIQISINEQWYVEDLHFVSVFEYESDKYLFLEYGESFWKAVYKLESYPHKTFKPIMQELLDPKLWTSAFRSTMAYSASRNQYLRITDGSKLDWQPKAQQD